MYQEAGHCLKCGAPYYVLSCGMELFRPTPIPICGCWNTVKTYTTTSSYVFDSTQQPLSGSADATPKVAMQPSDNGKRCMK